VGDWKKVEGRAGIAPPLISLQPLKPGSSPQSGIFDGPGFFTYTLLAKYRLNAFKYARALASITSGLVPRPE